MSDGVLERIPFLGLAGIEFLLTIAYKANAVNNLVDKYNINDENAIKFNARLIITKNKR
tara:strand:+ start:209 stop:385 length:177 start_codon:yes stop_codon:yes gene_type:complete